MQLTQSRYEPAQVEAAIYADWLANDCLLARPASGRPAFCISMPPPNITGVLHMGHALNNTIQDILTRFRRMQQREVLWLPGTDHAGIATQNVVEKALADDGLSREALGRDKFLERVWAWKEKHGGVIIEQLKRLGVSCDWSRLRFTMDEGLSHAVRQAFVRLHRAGLIYRGNYIVNWCPRCRTALADDEVEHVDEDGWLWHIRYPLAGQPRRFVVVATTRPETMLGDTAVAVHPEDERYAGYVSRLLELPLTGRQIPVITEEVVDARFGTGAVKVTPAHDPVDFEIGKRHDLPQVVVMDEAARMTKEAGEFAGLDRFEAREKIVAALQAKGLLEKVEAHQHAVGACYRCGAIIEPRLSDQWFVRMKPLARAAIDATERNRVRFHPARWTKVYLAWLENVRDWCISRQIWWGHRIPVWYCRECEDTVVEADEPAQCPRCGNTSLAQDPDVLDTWFSSALWPFSTLGWPDEASADLAFFYPTDVLVTDRGIIYFWVARMVMMGQYLMKKEPFGDVYIHGTILDEQGRKMSKSLGNGIDPVEMIDQYGADAVRSSLILLTVEGQDVRLSTSKFEMGRNFVNKVWNAGRLVLMRLSEFGWPAYDAQAPGGVFERWIISRLADTVASVTGALDKYRLNEALRLLYDFFWRDFCDGYLEFAKRTGLSKDAAPDERRATLAAMAEVLTAALRMLHPFIPFVTEELWRHAAHAFPQMLSGRLMQADWPRAGRYPRDAEAEAVVSVLRNMLAGIRNIRQEARVPVEKAVDIVLSFKSPEQQLAVEPYLPVVAALATANVAETGVGLARPAESAVVLDPAVETYVVIAGYIERERQRLTGRIQEFTDRLDKVEARLRNPEFTGKAPKEVVKRENQKRHEIQQELHRLQQHLAHLSEPGAAKG